MPPRITKKPFRYSFNEDAAVTFVEPAKKNEKVVFNIIFSHKAVKPDHLIRGSIHKPTVLGHIEMKEELAWVLHFRDRLSREEELVIEDHFKKTKLHLKSGSSADAIQRAFLHIIQEEITPFMIDIELGEENVEIPTP